MITQNRYDLGDMSFQGLSTDTKPALAPVNSLFLELDTKTLYYCAKSGSQSEETVFDDTVELATQIEGLDIGVITLADTIDVVFDGVEYNNLQKAGHYYGATWNESTQSVDYSIYPFRVNYGESYASFIESGEVGEHSFTIISGGETVIEETRNFYLHGYGNFTEFDPAETITVTINGEEYVCTNQDEEVGVYGATHNRETGEFDYSEFPFILYSNGRIDTVGIDGECSLTIVATVKTEAEWVKYGEAPSGGIVGDLSEGVTIRESDWIEDDDGYHVEVEPYVLNSGVQYTLYLSGSGGDTSDTATAIRDELERRYVNAVFFRDSIKITNDSEEGRTFVYGQHNQEITLRIEKHGGRQ